MQPFDRAWQVLKFTTGLPGSQNFKDKEDAALVREAMHEPWWHLMHGPKTHPRLLERQPRPLPFPKDHPGLAEYYAPTEEEIEQMQAEENRAHREEMDREYMRDMERRIDAGEVTPTDIFDEGGNAAAGEGWMSGGKPY